MAKKKKRKGKSKRSVVVISRRSGRATLLYEEDRRPRKIPKKIVFLRDEPGLHVRQPQSPIVPTPIVRPLKKEKIAIAYKGFQPEQRVTSCDKKRERRRRAFFGYLNAPHAGKGSSKRLSPRGDRFTVKC